jgi:hypothetical protein
MFNALGWQSQVTSLQARAGRDDCFEWSGGTSVDQHMVASACGDDGFDYQIGFTGAVPCALTLRNGQLTDAGARDARGLEGDNSELATAAAASVAER